MTVRIGNFLSNFPRNCRERTKVCFSITQQLIGAKQVCGRAKRINRLCYWYCWWDIASKKALSRNLFSIHTISTLILYQVSCWPFILFMIQLSGWKQFKEKCRLKLVIVTQKFHRRLVVLLHCLLHALFQQIFKFHSRRLALVGLSFPSSLAYSIFAVSR